VAVAAVGFYGFTGGSPMKKPRTLADSFSGRMQPVPGTAGRAGLLPTKFHEAAGFLAHRPVDAATEVIHDVEQLAPKGAVALSGDGGEVETGIDDSAAHGAAARLTYEVLQYWHEEFGVVRAGGARRPRYPLARGEGQGWLHGSGIG
jgi:hypothetical protein